MLNGLEAVFFYLFAFIAVGAAFMVISARNPVHSVLYPDPDLRQRRRAVPADSAPNSWR